MNREKIIIRTSVIGIVTNVLLAAFKAVVGVIAGSVAIVLDAVNNTSDALSSAITIIGTRIAEKKPDKEHPFGHGRVEYISSVSVAVIILYAGVTALSESVKKILVPRIPDYSPAAIVILVAAIITKVILGTYVKRKGEEAESDSLVGSGKDALLDAVISASTLAAAILFMTTGISTEAWLGAVISLVIIKAGIDMLRESISRILGERTESGFADKIKKTITDFPEVTGAYDLVLHSYGPSMLIGSVHIEIPETMTVSRLAVLEREITEKVMAEHNVVLAGIGIYSVDTENEYAMKIRDEIIAIVMRHQYALQVHGFSLYEEQKKIRFDVIIDYSAPDRESLYEHILGDVKERFPNYELSVVLDADTSE